MMFPTRANAKMRSLVIPAAHRCNEARLRPFAATFILAAAFVLLISQQARAQCTNPAEIEGAIVYNADPNVPQICIGTSWIALGALNPGAGGGACTNPAETEGAIVYNDDFDVLQYCDGENWRAVIQTTGGGGGCTAPASCPNVGDVCSDGSLFAGFVVYNNSSCEPLYVTDNNQSAAIQWKTATGTNDITDPDDHVDGQYNRDNRGGGTFPAFELCENNTYHSKSDWYLPARAELNLLWLNRAAINANAAGNFTTSSYWSSTEDDTNGAWLQNFGTGNQGTNFKTTNDAVRCVRRD